MPTATLTSQLDRGVGGGNQALNPLALTSHLLRASGRVLPAGAQRMETPDDPLSRGPPGLPIPPRSPFLGKCISYSVCNVGPSPGVWAAGGCGGRVAFCAAGWGWAVA